MILLIAAVFITVTGPDNQHIKVNANDVVSLREPRGSSDHVAAGTKCLVFTADGKYIGVRETCTEVFLLLIHGEDK
jgi:hypothetical protein